jgi:hypothetical protein
LWFGSLVAAALVVGTFAVVLSSVNGVLSSLSPPALAADHSVPDAEPSAPPLPVEADRTSCVEIGGTALRSPQEGVWFQGNCVAGSASILLAPATSCNQKALDPAGFKEVSPGLYVYRQSWAAAGYLWYASSEGCFDLVSARIVTAVCVDLMVSFSWDTSACSDHGGVLTWVNGP